MTSVTDQMSARDLLDHLLRQESHDEIHATIQAWLRANPHPTAPLYAVFGYPLTRPGDREMLGVYTSLDRAEAFVAAQDEAVQQNLRVEDLELDRYPSDDFWKKPEGGERRSDDEGERTVGRHLVEILQRGELLPDDAVAAIEAARNHERDVATQRIRIADLERGRAAHIDWLRETVASLPPAEAVEAIRRYLGDTPSRVVAELVNVAERILFESGPPRASDEFDARRWVEQWIHTPHPALGWRCPMHLLGTAEGLDEVRSLLERE